MQTTKEADVIMVYKREESMYPDVRNWLEKELNSRISDADEIHAYITSRTSVAKFLTTKGLAQYFSDEYHTYDIRVDITAVIIKGDKGELVFIECKLRKISLRDLSQLLGYSVVAKPLYSLIISPEGIADSLRSLITTFGRRDILKYADKREIALAKWDENKKDLDYTSIIPTGWSFI